VCAVERRTMEEPEEMEDGWRGGWRRIMEGEWEWKPEDVAFVVQGSIQRMVMTLALVLVLTRSLTCVG
jgi:hypothetical protein